MDVLTACLDEQFARLHLRTRALVEAIAPENLYREPRSAPGASAARSGGEHLLRSAAVIEQTFGGITANLWDDPFEWTLPETLRTPARVAEYLDEVDATRRRGFASFVGDGDLRKVIATPSGEMRTLGALLVETLARAAHHQGRAYAVFSLFRAAPLPRV